MVGRVTQLGSIPSTPVPSPIFLCTMKHSSRFGPFRLPYLLNLEYHQPKLRKTHTHSFLYSYSRMSLTDDRRHLPAAVHELPKKLPILSYNSLTVGDIDANDVHSISQHPDTTFRDVVLHLTQNRKSFLVQYAKISGLTYLRTVEKYQVREFEKLFGFSSMCTDFVLGKVIVVRDTSVRSVFYRH